MKQRNLSKKRNAWNKIQYLLGASPFSEGDLIGFTWEFCWEEECYGRFGGYPLYVYWRPINKSKIVYLLKTRSAQINHLKALIMLFFFELESLLEMPHYPCQISFIVWALVSGVTSSILFPVLLSVGGFSIHLVNLGCTHFWHLF